MSTILKEGALTFTFQTVAQACKYDTWSYYRNQFQQGCSSGNKAVDLLCEANGESWLIEVKDYRHHPRTKPGGLADEVAIKVRDTLAGLVAASVGANDRVERDFAARMVRAKRFRVVCHLEQPAKTTRLRPRLIEPEDLFDKLRRLLKAIDRHPIVMDRSVKRQDLPWTVA